MENKSGMTQAETIEAWRVLALAAAPGRINGETRRRDYEVGERVVTDYSVIAELRDPRNGNLVVRELLSIPSAADAKTLITEMRKELSARGRKVAAGRRVEREMGH